MHTVTLKERAFNGKAAPDWATAVTRLSGLYYWEESLGQENDKCFQNMNGALLCCYNKNTIKGYDASWLLPAIEEEQLPPAPGSVMYFNSTADANNRQHLLVQPHWKLDEHLTVAVVKDGCKFNPYAYGNTLSIDLDPDAALQLAHDLRRMAMDIKRKLKQEQAQ